MRNSFAKNIVQGAAALSIAILMIGASPSFADEMKTNTMSAEPMAADPMKTDAMAGNAMKADPMAADAEGRLHEEGRDGNRRDEEADHDRRMRCDVGGDG